MSVEEIASAGIWMTRTWSPNRPRSSLPRSNSGRVAAMKRAVCSTESGSFQVRISRTASAPVMKKRSAALWNSRRARSVSAVYVGPPRVDLERGNREMGVGSGGEHWEKVPVLGRGALPLLPRLPRRDEDDLVEPELPASLLGTHEVADVDRIEGAAHDAEPAASVAFRGALPALCRPVLRQEP